MNDSPTGLATPPHVRAVPDPKRFATARSTLLIDRFMAAFIRVGGAGVVIAVGLIFVFILKEVLPLFGSADVEHRISRDLPKRAWLALGSDERGERPFLVDAAGALVVVPLDSSAAATSEVPLALPAGSRLTTAAYDAHRRTLVGGSDQGRLTAWTLPAALGGAELPKELAVADIGTAGKPLIAADFKDAGSAKLAACIQDLGDRRAVHAVVFDQKMVLGRKKGDLTVVAEADLSAQVHGRAERVLVGDAADSVVVVNQAGEVSCFTPVDGAFTLRQRFTPFPEPGSRGLAGIDFLFGGVSLVCLSGAGENVIYSLYRKPGEEQRSYGAINRLDPVAGDGPAWYARSIRNKAYLIGRGTRVSLRFPTTGVERWATTLDQPVRFAQFSGKYDRALFVDTADRLHAYHVDDPHPEAGLGAFFAPLWYEGYDAPETAWQSSGSTDDFQPKFSLIPLIIGSLKGTFYALLFAVPIALLAAIYTAEFMNPRFKLYVKPTMELMASLPSVVLGFIAALFLAPLIETRVPAIIVAVVLVPLTVAGAGWAWTRLPADVRNRLKPGCEFLAVVPLLVLAVLAAGWLGPLLERALFTVTDPATGRTVADFRLWWPQATGASFEQRNSLVVGFVMGFAVIPILFTIAEDSLTGVPPALRSGSLALGASRWQTAMRVVVPTASAGIFSAIMIAFGRAVGETMIVVMATGNTPVHDFNIFSGMRTLSANIAVELPEAPHHSTLYRALFLGALVLFMLTFAVNTAAELLRQWLRERYRTV